MGISFAALGVAGNTVLHYDELYQDDVADDVVQAVSQLTDEDRLEDPVTPFQRRARSLLKRLEAISGIDVDWTRVDLASRHVQVRDFPFESGTAIDALNAYSQWTGLLVLAGRTGALYALNPNNYESGRLPERVVLSYGPSANRMMFHRDGSGWASAIVNDCTIGQDGGLSLWAPLTHHEKVDWERVGLPLLTLEVGDIVNFGGSTVSGRRLDESHYQLAAVSFDFRQPLADQSAQGAKGMEFFGVEHLRRLLGHLPQEQGQE